jgi:Putative transmembrane protein (PGPGW)
MDSVRTMDTVKAKETQPKTRRIEMFGRGFTLPQGRWQRIALGVALVLGGIVGFLPILGFWMIPLGLFVLSLELASVRRLRRRLIVRFSKRKEKTG